MPRALIGLGVVVAVAGTLLSAALAARERPRGEEAPGKPGQEVFLRQDRKAREILGRMTLEEKVGQMCQPDQSALKDPADIGKFFLGSLLSGGGSGPKNKEDYNLQGWTDMVDRYQKEALKTRLAIPLLYGVDAVHGHNNIPGAVIYPHNIGLGCARNADLVRGIARATAEEVRATGINWAFAPCVAVPRDIRWGRTYEGFAEDPDIVKELGAAAVRGLQGDNLADPLAVVACAKHFVGDGGTAMGTGKGLKGKGLDQGDTRCDEATLRRIHLPGYLTTVRAGAGTIMPSYSSWNGVKCHASKKLLTDILKKELGFEGFVISDYNAIDQIDPDYKKCIETAINAGIDMVMLTDKYPQFCRQLAELVREGTVPQERIDDAVARILRVKLAMGLLDSGRSPLADRALHRTFGSPGRRALARQAVRESLVLLKNDKKVLPISKSAARIHVAGPAADDLGTQCGGWTTTWQGSPGNHVPGGTSILEAIKRAAPASTRVTGTRDGTGAEGADVCVVVVGEKPYAEMEGDTEVPVLDQASRDVVANAAKAGVPLVVVLLSGRPVLLDGVLDRADALVAAWLPGSEGAGVVDVLLGEARPTGKLSHAWPRTKEQIPGKTGDKPLFPLGHGLTYP